jgi:hypothetical protein
MERFMFHTMGLCLLLATTNLTRSPAALLPGERHEPSPYWLDDGRSCGPLCLMFLDKYFGGSHDYRAITDVCPPGPEGTTLAELKHAAEQLGYYTLPFEGTAGQLTRLRYPAILQFRSGANPQLTTDHFVAILGWDGASQKFDVFNPPGTLGEVSYGEVDKHFSGEGMLLFDAPLPPLKDILAPAPLWPLLTAAWTGSLLLLVLIWNKIRIPRCVRQFDYVTTLRKVKTLLPIAACVLAGCEQPHPDSVANSALIAEAEILFDAGEVLEGTLIKHVFQVVNNGDKPLRFKELVGH